ncbi:N-acetylneuraminate synthase [Allocatelliglobosispora scoriae]|uniref:N-acetylneuraminate synthase n=1 Tax=Allocatelliglobosispora scoriae TaxID=643052 RepID=A0A841C5P9_9ACTN|nr:pseudaminic acid synthase [Allocatelliglobosispora scoriae]MBB5874392.1 N-acetylneuraminate synthase [Allocatelliglobosispora scoriae]
MTSIEIAGHPVGPDVRPFVIAEMSGNHNGSLDRALAIVDAVAGTGAHALKLQTYTPDTITIDCDGPAFRVGDGHELWGGQSLYQLFQQAHTPYEWHGPIFERAREHGLTVFSAPFDPTAVELLESLGAPAYKIASSELVDLPLIRLVARTGKPLIISTGMAGIGEIAAALEAARDAGAEQIVLLACTASYPSPPQESNLRRIPMLAETFGVQVGLSDHTTGIGVPLAAVALGAIVIEKHLTLDRADGGVDAAFSLSPAEMSALVAESERAWQALGSTRIGPTGSEREGLRFRRSLYVVADVRAGDPVGPGNVRSIRPAGGLPPGEFDTVRGRVFSRDAVRGTPLTWDLV